VEVHGLVGLLVAAELAEAETLTEEIHQVTLEQQTQVLAVAEVHITPQQARLAVTEALV
jgi:hypothetical protein